LKEKDLIKKTLASEENAKQHGLKYNIEVDTELAVENFEDNNDLLVKLIAIYIKASDYSKVIDTMVIANQLLENKKVYTEVEVLDKIKTAVNDHCNYQINEENLTKYL
jgi:mevalonate kinase